MKRRNLLASASAALLAPLAGCRRIPQSGLDAAAMVAGDWRASELVADALARIAACERRVLALRAVVELNPEAHALARTLDAVAERGPLQGVPVLLKDNIDTADRMRTTAGSLALVDAPVPGRDAAVVARLRAAGAVLLGKTNLSEWANLRSPHSTSGWSARGGLTRNPHDLRRSASGSSSGSAAAVAAGLVPAALGTETNGSIVSPASCCGIVGLKPTLGLVSRAGIIPLSRWQDTAGPMTRTVRDAALLLNALAGSDPHDGFTDEADRRRPADYTAGFGTEALRGVRLGVVRSLCGDEPRVLAVFEHALEVLRGAGAVLVDSVEIPYRREASGLAWLALLTEFRRDVNTYLEARGGRVRSLAELIAFNAAHADREMTHFGQEFFEEAERREGREGEAEEARRRARALAGPQGIGAALQAQRLDALVCATNDPATLIRLDGGDRGGRTASTPAAVAGWPHLTVPMGAVEGLPVGLSFFGEAWSEARLLAMGHAFEHAAGVRLEPAFAGREEI
jgi:amidase